MPEKAAVRVVLNLFPSIAAELGPRADAIVAEAAHEAAAQAAANAPVDTGQLRGSISARQEAPGHWVVEADTRYAAYVEYGTKEHGGPQPFMTPAAHTVEPQFIGSMQHVVPGT